MLRLVEGFRPHVPAPPFASVGGDVWALARLGTPRHGMTPMARSGGCVDRPLASWARWLAEAPGDRGGGTQTRVARRLPPLGSRLEVWEARWAAGDTTLVPQVWGQRPGVPPWHDHRGDPARGESLVGHPWALSGVGSAWGVGDRCWPVWARGRPGPRNPLGWVAGPAGVPRVEGGAGVVARGRERRPDGGPPPWRVVADAAWSPASGLKPLGAAGRLVSSRRRQDAVGGDEPVPVGDKRPRGRPRPRGRRWKLATGLPGAPRTALTGRLAGQAEPRQVVGRDVGGRAVPPTGRVVVGATTQEPSRLVRPDRPRPPAALLQLEAARCPRALTRSALPPSGGRGDEQGSTRLAIQRGVHLAWTACWLWRLPLLQAQQAPWRTTAPASPAGELRPLRGQRLHRARRRFVRRRLFAAAAPGADCPTTEVSEEPIVRITA